MFDDIVGPGWCIVACEPDVLKALTSFPSRCMEGYRRTDRDGRCRRRASALEDVGGTYRAWFAAHSCSVAVVRPDWYLYGTARNGQ